MADKRKPASSRCEAQRRGWVAGTGSLPTLVCSRCADAIAAGRFWRGAA